MRARITAMVVATTMLSLLATGSAANAGGRGGIIRNERPAAGRYIVTLAPGATTSASALARAYGGSVDHVYGAALKGFSVRMSESRALALSKDSRVASVEEDGIVSAVATQDNVTWGLDRIDQRALPLSTTYTYNADGAGVRAYVIDTGIQLSHTQFGGRAVNGTDTVDGGSADDCNGHGTHVAGTIGGSDYGVAKNVTLVAVRVLNCQGSGTWAGVVAGIDWVTANHAPNQPAVANMSLGGGASSSVDTAVRNSIADGVTYAIAAGNGNSGGVGQDACRYSPARVTEALTVGATDKTDKKSSWSNYGTCLDLFAPGVSITSAWIGSGTAANTISGTSMATPHVAGVGALYLQGHPTDTPSQVASAITAGATKNVVSNPGKKSPNRLLYSLI